MFTVTEVFLLAGLQFGSAFKYQITQDLKKNVFDHGTKRTEYLKEEIFLS